MFPLIAIGGAIGAVVSVIQGASWLSGQLDSSKSTTSVGGKPEAKPQAQALSSQFEAALAAQAAGQTLPAAAGAVAASPASAAILPAAHGTDYDTLARMKAGTVAYSHVGEHRSNRANDAKPTGAEDDRPVTRS
jgi:hypothetical protein